MVVISRNQDKHHLPHRSARAARRRRPAVVQALTPTSRCGTHRIGGAVSYGELRDLVATPIKPASAATPAARAVPKPTPNRIPMV